MMVREASGRASVNLGGIAEVFTNAFVPEMGQKRFLFPLHHLPPELYI